MRNSWLSVTPLEDVLLWVELNSNEGILSRLDAGNVPQPLPLVVPGQSSPELSQVVPRKLYIRSFLSTVPSNFVKFVGVRHREWKLMVIFSSLISRITSGGASTGGQTLTSIIPSHRSEEVAGLAARVE